VFFMNIKVVTVLSTNQCVVLNVLTIVLVSEARIISRHRTQRQKGIAVHSNGKQRSLKLKLSYDADSLGRSKYPRDREYHLKGSEMYAVTMCETVQQSLPHPQKDTYTFSLFTNPQGARIISPMYSSVHLRSIGFADYREFLDSPVSPCRNIVDPRIQHSRRTSRVQSRNYTVQ
jgi:hypothetical protein